MLARFQGDQRLKAILSINYLNSSFCNLKQCIKDEFIINYWVV